MQHAALHLHRRIRGFTLVELMVTLTVAAILFGIAIPSFVEMSVRNRLAGYSNDIMSSVNYARSEAVRRGTTVSVCKSNDSTSCGGDWQDGWIVFVNPDGDATVDGGETILKTYPALAQNYSIGSTADFATAVNYGVDGSSSATGVMTVCHDDQEEGARAIVITRLRPRVARDSDDNRVPNLDDGNDIDSCAAP